jgi:glycosyltransferase involved in cell wall biosynthesis
MIKIVVHAENIKVGGGLVVLKKLIDCLPNDCTLYILNKTIEEEMYAKNVIFLRDSLKTRLVSRFSLSFPKAIHVHFGNLPPIYSSSKKVKLYFQNSLLLEKWKFVDNERWYLKLRIFIERMFLNIFIQKSYTIFVQTNYMMILAKKRFPKNNVKLLKFSDVYAGDVKAKFHKKNFQIIYIGGLEKYKNLGNVLLGLANFCQEFDVFVNLLIIGVSKNSIKNLIADSFENLSIKCKNRLERQEIFSDIKASDLLIFSSDTESLGLPLIEAHSFGIDIIASDSNYVLESCRPKFLFNPKDPNSLKRALILYFELNEFPKLMQNEEIQNTLIS